MPPRSDRHQICHPIIVYASFATVVCGLVFCPLKSVTAQRNNSRAANQQATGAQSGSAAAQQGGDQAPAKIQVVAVVNGQTITRQQLAQQCAARFGNEVLESMINKMLVFNEIQRQQIMISEQDVHDELNRQAKRFNLSLERYVQLIESERGVSVDKLKRDIIWMELALKRLAAQNIAVTPHEVANRMQFEFGPRVRVAAIALATRQEAEQVLSEVTQNPNSFGRVAKERSMDPQSASLKGLLPPIRHNMGDSTLENAAFALAEGEISSVIQMGEQFVILKCMGHEPAVDMPPEQRSIAEQRIAEQLKEEKLSDSAAELFKQLQETVEIVNVYNDESLRQQMPGVAATVGGTPVSMDKLYEECITRYGRDVLKAEINRMIVAQELQRSSLAVSDQEIRAEIEQAARMYGYFHDDGSVDLDRWLAYVTKGQDSKVQIYIQDEVWPSAAMKKLVEHSVEVTNEDLEKGFVANFGERVECLAIVLDDQRTAQRVWQMAKNNPTEDYFGKLAHQYSIEPASRANYGQVPPIPRHGGKPMLEEEAFSLQPNEISGLVEVGDTWIILFCQGRTTPKVKDFDAVKNELYNDILEKKLRLAMRDRFDTLVRSAQIDNFLEGTSQPGAAAMEAARNNRSQQPASRR